MKINIQVVLISVYLVFSLLLFRIAQDIKGMNVFFAMFCAIMIFLRRDFSFSSRRIFLVPLVLSLAVAAFQFTFCESYSHLEYFGAMSWVICPLCVYLIPGGRRAFVRLLALLWLLNVLMSLRQLLLFGGNLVGLPGNQNWHASLVLGLAPVVIYLLHKESLRSDSAVFRLCKYIVFAFVVFTIFKTESRAAMVSAAFCSVVFVYFATDGDRFARSAFFLCLLAIFAVAVMSFFLFHEYFAGLVQHDMRIAMWTGGWDLFLDNFWFGVGDARYLSEYTAYRPIGYFLRSHHFAHITEHPHNHVLYMLGSFGLIGGGAILMLTFHPVLLLFRKYRRLSSGSRAVLFSFLLLLVCSLFDMTYYHWHNFFAMSVLLGLLWKTAYAAPPPARRRFSLWFLLPEYLFRAACAGILIFALVRDGADNYRANILYNRGFMASDKPENLVFSLACMDAAANLNPNFFPALFSAGILCMQDFKDPYMAEAYLERLQATPNPSISRSNLKMADAKTALRRRSDAIRYLERDIMNYPISIEALYKKLMLEKELGLDEKLHMTTLMLARALEHKGLEWEDVPVIAKNTYFDNKFEEYKLLKKRLLDERKDEKQGSRMKTRP